MHFKIHIKFTKILGQFKIYIYLYIYLWNVILSFFSIVNLIFVNYNNVFEYIIE
jgi:hypothetical protein